MFLELILLFFIPQIYCQFQDGDIHLVGGSYQWEGRVEIYLSGSWGTIADSDWTEEDAAVTCNALGHFLPGAVPQSNAYFGEGEGPIHLDSVECSGLENRLIECGMNHSDNSTSHLLDVGVKCQPALRSYREGDIRLVRGAHNWEGCVEIFWSGSWGTIRDSSWTNDDARVACGQLQHSFLNSSAIECCDSYEDGSTSEIAYISDVVCNGTEERIIDCSYFNNNTVMASQLVGVQCQQASEVEVLPYITFGVTDGVDTKIVPSLDDGLSQPITDVLFPFGSSLESTIYVGTNGYFTFKYFTRYSPFLFNENTYWSLVAPFFFDIDISRGIGQIKYEIHTVATSKSILSQVDLFINEHMQTDFRGEWLLVATWDEVPPFGSFYNITEINTFQGILTTNFTRSFAVFTYFCGDLSYSYNAAIGFVSPGGFFANHPAAFNGSLISCSNLPGTPWVNVVYEITTLGDCKTGDIRLVDGETEVEGRVEICHIGKWQRVCGKNWTENNTAVVCRQLGFSNIIGDSTHYSSEFSSGIGPILVNFTNCTGSEPKLWGRCSNLTQSSECSHDDDIGVHCQPASCSDGQLELINSNYDSYQHIEICSNQRWETLSIAYWSDSNTRVACNGLGYERGGHTYYVYQSFDTKWGGSQRHSRYYKCTGSEQTLSECDNCTDPTLRSQSGDVLVKCFTVNCAEGDLQLRELGGGRLEISNGRWYRVHSKGWTLQNTEVVCTYFGYENGIEENLDLPQAHSKPYYSNGFNCSGNELSLLDCISTNFDASNHIFNTEIICKKPSCSDGDLRLVGGQSESDGRLEICLNKRWTTINERGWTKIDTIVACNQLYNNYSASESDVLYGEIQRGALDAIQTTKYGCSGDEGELISCHSNPYREEDRSLLDKVISISCSSSLQATTATGSNDDSGGEFNLIIVAFCFLAILIITFFVAYVINFIRRKRNTRETVVIGDNVSYIISSTGKVHAVEDPYYSSLLSQAPREEFPPAPQQPLPPLPLTTTVRDEQEAEIKETETRDTENQDKQIQEITVHDEARTKDSKTQGSEATEDAMSKTPHDHIYDSCQ